MARRGQYRSLGHVIAAVIENRGWAPTWPRPLAVRLWAARLKTTPREGCDAAFLFAAAACYGMRVHVHYKTRAGLMANTQFARALERAGGDAAAARTCTLASARARAIERAIMWRCRMR